MVAVTSPEVTKLFEKADTYSGSLEKAWEKTRTKPCTTVVACHEAGPQVFDVTYTDGSIESTKLDIEQYAVKVNADVGSWVLLGKPPSKGGGKRKAAAAGGMSEKQQGKQPQKMSKREIQEQIAELQAQHAALGDSDDDE